MHTLIRTTWASMFALGLAAPLVAGAGLGIAAVATAFAAQAAPSQAPAEADAPARVGRIARTEGEVSWFDIEQGLWQPAEINRPLTGGDRLSTAADGRAELRIGSTVLRLGAGSELEVLRLDDAKIVLHLHAGALALRVRTRDLAEEIELVTDEARLAPRRAGHYRLDRTDDRTLAGAWRGELRVLADANAGFDIAEGERHELWRDASGRARSALARLPDDALAAWTLQAEANEQRSASARHVSPEMTGAEELDRHGRWDRHPDYGAIWVPLVVASGWAPYRDGRWVWVRPWGWTWVDAAPWGFAPFHYGRWVHWSGRWAWVPGAYAARPVYSPGLVAWVGGPGYSIGVQIGRPYPHHAPQVGWVPLAPHEPYRPHYRLRDRDPDRDRPGLRPVLPVPPVAQAPGRSYIPDRVPRDGRGDRDERGARNDRNDQDTGPRHWRNQDAPGGLTVVTRDALLRRLPVRDVALPVRVGASPLPQAPLPAVLPPPRRVEDGADVVGPQRPLPPAARPALPARPQPGAWTAPEGRADTDRPAASPRAGGSAPDPRPVMPAPAPPGPPRAAPLPPRPVPAQQAPREAAGPLRPPERAAEVPPPRPAERTPLRDRERPRSQER